MDFVQPLVTYDKNVETWMNELEHIMRRSVRQVLYRATLDYEKTPRVQWVQQHPGQAVLNGSQIHWTKDVEEAISKKSLRELLDKLNSQLMDLVRNTERRWSTQRREREKEAKEEGACEFFDEHLSILQKREIKFYRAPSCFGGIVTFLI